MPHKTHNVEVSDEAKKDLRDIARYISIDSPYRALTFTEKLLNDTKLLLSIFPFSGIGLKKSGKERMIVRGGYYVFYKVYKRKREVMIARVTSAYNYNSYKEFIH